MKKILVVLIITLFLGLSFVCAAPVFVYTHSLDSDTVYGPNDPIINIVTAWTGNDSGVSGNLSCINGPDIVSATSNGDNTYTLSYTIITPPSDRNCTIPITALDLSDDSTSTDYSFNITIDSTPPTVSSLSYSPLVVFNFTDVRINATITDGNIKEVFSSGDWDSSWNNYSISDSKNPVYEIDSSYIGDGETINFAYHVSDLANNIGSAFSSFTVTKRIVLTVIPTAPDGLNGWYITVPRFILTPDTGRTAFYRWDWLQENSYAGPFNYSEIPGGIEDLSYWSNDSSNNKEPEQVYLVKLDTYAPIATNLAPENNSKVSEKRPKIYAYLDEIYQGNSGVDKSSVVMTLDGNAVVPTVNSTDTLDAEATYNPTLDLSEGKHNVSIFIKDNAGNSRTATWYFDVILPESFTWKIFSPINSSYYNTARVLFNISTNREAKIESSLDGGSFGTLCRNCDNYERIKYLREGAHYITLKATNGAENVLTKEIFIEVDSIAPRIMRTSPKKGTYIRGSDFTVGYTELNLKKTTLQLYEIGTNTTLNTSSICQSGTNQECTIHYNLTGYNGELEYSFFLQDNFDTTQSKPVRIYIDNLNPIITVISPLNIYNYPRGVLFNITLDNEVKTLEYSEGGRARMLCSRCDSYTRKKTFGKGNHTINITATDFAGNIATHNVEFGVN